MTERSVLAQVAAYAERFLATIDDRPVRAEVDLEELRRRLVLELPELGSDPAVVLDELARDAEAGLVKIPGGRYFGFVIGGATPTALAADWLTTTWDQNAGLYACGPSAAVVEEVAGAWVKDLLGLPEGASFAFVTGCQMAHVTGLAAARNRVLASAGWDVERDGLAGAPPLTIVASEERHVTIDRALRLLGVGTAAVRPVAADSQGRIDTADLRRVLASVRSPVVVCAQAGNVNTGACDAFEEVCAIAHDSRAWVHVDGAFGLWAAASPRTSALTAGIELADSWATDAHKWLNTPYDCGIAVVADPEAHRAAMGVHADYLVHSDDGGPRDAVDWTPEFSRRARAFPVYAGIRALGRTGVAALVDRCCAHARTFAARLGDVDGVEVLNDVVLNQVLVRFLDAAGEHDRRTREIIAGVQDEGTCWLSGTTWHGMGAMRISVSGCATTDDDVERSAAAILRVARDVG